MGGASLTDACDWIASAGEQVRATVKLFLGEGQWFTGGVLVLIAAVLIVRYVSLGRVNRGRLPP